MPRISVIVAARDAAQTLEATLDSILAQTYTDWEVVLTDDGSSDGTGDLARAALGERVRVVRHDVAQGPSAARNAAAAQARGELLATLDADDRWLPHFLATQVAAFDAARGRVGVVTCDARMESEGGEDRGLWSEVVGRADPVTLDSLLRTNTVFTSVVCSAEAFRAVGGYETSLRRGEDLDLWLRLLEAGWDIVGPGEPLAVYRISEDGLTGDTVSLAAATRRVYERALERGRLSPAQRRLARRQLRLQALVRQRARIAEQRAAGGRAIGPRLAALPRTAWVALEHPERWLHWVRHRGPRNAGPARHA